MIGEMKINEGGVCDNCGLPRLAHDGDRCFDRIAPDSVIDSRVQEWEAIVAPARDAHRSANREARDMRRHERKGRVSAAEVEATERRRDKLLVEYRAAIRRADREA